jgi:hypothetical protein
MIIKSGLLRVMVASTLGVAALLIPNSAASAAASSDTSQSLDFTEVISATCSESWHVTEIETFPIIGDDVIQVKAEITKNPCGLSNGLEAGLQLVTNITGDLNTYYGGDVHGTGKVSEIDGDGSVATCHKFGARWWNNVNWVYTWRDC